FPFLGLCRFGVLRRFRCTGFGASRLHYSERVGRAPPKASKGRRKHSDPTRREGHILGVSSSAALGFRSRDRTDFSFFCFRSFSFVVFFFLPLFLFFSPPFFLSPLRFFLFSFSPHCLPFSFLPPPPLPPCDCVLNMRGNRMVR